MKSILISIQPKWCGLIASGKKTVEVRKTKPKLETPFKVYIYCTKDNKLNFWIGKRYSYSDERSHNLFDRCGNGKVIGEFVCDKITNADVCLNNRTGWFVNCMYSFEGSCLSETDILSYCPKESSIYGWHISDLVIYDKPKELSEFCTIDNEAVKQCKHRERAYNNPDYTNGAWLLGSYVCNKGEIDWCTKCKVKPLARPPQSWCYVEEMG